MKTHRMFFLFSLCVHILLLAFTETMMITSARFRVPSLLKLTFLQTALPRSVGERSGEPSRPVEGTSKLLSPEPVRKTPPKSPPQPKVRQKPAPKPKPAVASSRSRAVPPPVEKPTHTGLLAEGNPTTLVEDGYAALGSGQATPGQSGDRASGTGLGGTRGKGRGGKTLASPNYGVNPKPPYPLIARRMGVEGVVILRVLVHADGSVAKALVSQSSESTLLDESALKTVREHWRFLPARLNGEPVESWVEVPIHFVLAG